MSTVLRLEDVTYTYPAAARPALRSVSVEVRAGDFVLLAGPSAGGKSTLLRAGGALVPHFHGGRFAGRATVGGLDTRDHGPGAIAAVAGSLFQDPETQVVLGAVRNELAFGLENRGHGAAAVARGVEEVALALGIEALLERPTSELSGGELQRVALAAALAGRPRLLLLDEPTSQLDPVAGDELVWLLRRLNEEWGTAVVLAEHRLERCLAHADRVVVLEDGAVTCDAPPRGFLEWAAERAPALQTPGGPPLRASRPAPAARRGQGGAPHPARARPPRRRRRAAAAAARRARAPPPAPRRAGLAASARRLVRAARRAHGPAGRRPGARAGGARGPHGPQRRRQVDAAARPRRPGPAHARSRAGRRTRRAAAAESGRLPRPRARARGGLGRGARGRRPRRPRGAPPARPLRRRAPAARARDRPRRREPPAAVLLDEPTRGMDRAAKGDLADRLRALAADGAAVLVATHDAEFAAALRRARRPARRRPADRRRRRRARS